MGNNNNKNFRFGVPMAGTTNNVGSPKKTYVPNPMYEYVKNTLRYKVAIEGIRDVDAIRQYYRDYLPKIGAYHNYPQHLIKYHLEYYGLPEVEYWIGRMQQEGYLP